jgi:hypothetical protein
MSVTDQDSSMTCVHQLQVAARTWPIGDGCCDPLLRRSAVRGPPRPPSLDNLASVLPLVAIAIQHGWNVRGSIDGWKRLIDSP